MMNFIIAPVLQWVSTLLFVIVLVFTGQAFAEGQTKETAQVVEKPKERDFCISVIDRFDFNPKELMSHGEMVSRLIKDEAPWIEVEKLHLSKFSLIHVINRSACKVVNLSLHSCTVKRSLHEDNASFADWPNVRFVLAIGNVNHLNTGMYPCLYDWPSNVILAGGYRGDQIGLPCQAPNAEDPNHRLAVCMSASDTFIFNHIAANGKIKPIRRKGTSFSAPRVAIRVFQILYPEKVVR